MFSKRVYQIITLSLLALFITACGVSKPKDGIADPCRNDPKWYSKEDCPKGHLCGYGSASSGRSATAEKKAKANARTDLLSSISTLINSELLDALDEFKGRADEQYEEQLTTDNTMSIIEGRITNSIVHKKEKDMCDGNNHYWVSVKKDIDGTDFNKLFSAVAKDLEISDEAREFINEKKDWAEEAKSNLRKYD